MSLRGVNISHERDAKAEEGIKNVIASASEAIHRRLPRKSDDFLAMTGVKVASKPAEFHLPLAMTVVCLRLMLCFRVL